MYIYIPNILQRSDPTNCLTYKLSLLCVFCVKTGTRCIMYLGKLSSVSPDKLSSSLPS